MADREKVKKFFDKSFLEIKESICILLKGDWGVGKTYFCKEYFRNFREENKDYKVAYITVSNKKSLNEIRESLIGQVLSFGGKFLKSILKIIKRIPKIEDFLNMSSLWEIIIEKMTENKLNDKVIVIFDEIERMDENLSRKDFLGFITYLKEIANVKVLLVMNEEKLNENEEFLEIYNEYKEKIVDYEIQFSPTVKENFKIVGGLLKTSYEIQDILKNFLLEYNINNIRIMNKLARLINDFSFIEEIKKISNEVKFSFYEYLVRFGYIYFKFNFFNFDSLEQYIFDIIPRTNEGEKRKMRAKNEEYEQYIKYLEGCIIQSCEFFLGFKKKYMEILNLFFRESEINKEKVQNTLVDYTNLIKNRITAGQIDEFFDRFYFNLSYSLEDLNRDILNFFDEYGDDIVDLLDFQTIIPNLNLLVMLNEAENKKKERDIFEKKMYELVELYIQKYDSTSLERLSQSILRFGLIPDIRQYLVRKTQEKKRYEAGELIDLENLKDIVHILKEVYKGNYNEFDSLVINNMNKDFLVKWSKKDSEFFKRVIWLYNNKCEDSDNRFNIFCKNMKEAIDEIKKEHLSKILLITGKLF